MIEALEDVESVFLYLDNEEFSYMIPSNIIKEAHSKSDLDGTACYSHENGKRQWRINVFADEREYKPQGAERDESKIDICMYAIKNND